MLAVALGVYFYTRMDSEIRRHVQQTLSEHFPHLNISVGAARLVENRGIAVHNVVISETNAHRLENNLLVIDELFLECDVHLAQLVQGPPEIRTVILRHSQIWITKSRNGRWNFESFWPLPHFGKKSPQVVVEDARVSLVDHSHSQTVPLDLRDVDFTLTPINHPQSNEASTAVDPSAESGSTAVVQQNSPSSSTQAFLVKGSMGGSLLKKGQFEIRFDPSAGTVSISSTFEELNFNSELYAWAQAYSGNWLDEMVVQGEVDGEINIDHQLGSDQQPRFAANLSVSGGKIEHPQLPRPLTEVQCEVIVANHRVRIDSLSGNCGSAGVALRLERQSRQANSAITLAMYLENLPLDEQLYRALPDPLREAWDRFQPTGSINADVQATFDGAEWQPQVVLTGRQLAFESDKLSYRVSDGTGTIRYTSQNEGRPAVIDVDLVAYGAGQPINFKGQVFDPLADKLGWMEVTGTDLEIDQRIISAMPEKTRDVIESLRPEGKFHLHWRIDRTQQDQLTPRTYLRLELVGCRINYEKFPYPLSEISGLILAEDKQWTFRDLVSHGARRIQCQGHLRPVAQGNELSLRFTGQEVPLDDELRKALPEQAKRAWDELRPRGRVNMSAEIFHTTGFSQPSISVAVQPRPESATVQPNCFPYLLEQIRGSFNYQDGRVLMTDVSAQHGRTTVRSNGNGIFREDGSWELQLDGFAADKLAIRRDLVVAMPARLQKMVDQLRPTGSFDIHNGALRFAKGSDPASPLESQWDIQLGCLQTDLQVGVELQNIHGSVRLMGSCQGSKWHSAGELDIDTATFQEVQFTNIRGPIWVDETSFLLGRWASEKQSQPASHLSAKVYGGALLGDLWVTYDGLPQYSAEATLSDVNLQRLMVERLHGQQNFSGNLAAGFRIRGNGRSLHSLTGDGEIKITEANIYELPLLMGILKVLRSGNADNTAFNQCDMRFQLQGRHIMFDQLDFLGDAVSLYGKGTSNFDQQINLVFHAVMGRNDFRLPFMKSLVDHAGQQIMQMYVDGTLSEPKIHTQAFPGINQIIQQIQTDVDNAVTSGSDRNQPVLSRWGRQH